LIFNLGFYLLLLFANFIFTLRIGCFGLFWNQKGGKLALLALIPPLWGYVPRETFFTNCQLSAAIVSRETFIKILVGKI
jgi:hypothetical protein